MSEHKVTLKWERGGTEFSYQRYPRDHTWSFDGGHTMTATAAPAYLGNPANVDPEEAFVASLASCHMLTFLSIACKQKFVLDSYEDPGVLDASRSCRIDARQLVESTGALYLVATASDQSRLAPLFLGLLDQVTRAAYERAASARASDGQVVRMDRQRLLLLLDEAANIAPIPDLATLASTAGGEGVQVVRPHHPQRGFADRQRYEV